MPIGLAFWILMLLWLIGGWWGGRWTQSPVTWGPDLLLFILLALLGWHDFGAALHG